MDHARASGCGDSYRCLGSGGSYNTVAVANYGRMKNFNKTEREETMMRRRVSGISDDA